MEDLSLGTYDMLMEFLLAEDLMTKAERKAMLTSSDIAKVLQGHLSSLSKANKIQLLEYEWAILPVERIKVSIVTDRNNREFTYNY